MIGHILKKDLKLLWPAVAGLMLAEGVTAGVRIILGISSEPTELVFLAHTLPLVVVLGLILIILLAVQQDNLVGDRQDWLVRPVRRCDLLLAKLAFVVVAIQGPLLLVDIIEALIQGFSVSAAIAASLAHGLIILCMFTVPALMLGAMTQSVVGALILAVVLIILYSMSFALAVSMGWTPHGSFGSGYLWVAAAASALLYLAGLGTLAVYQYYSRRTLMTRALSVVVTTVSLLVLFLFPWEPSLVVQRWFDSAPATDRPIVIAVGSRATHVLPLDQRAHVSGDRDYLTTQTSDDPQPWPPRKDLGPAITFLRLPLRVTGLPQGGILVADRSVLRIASADGTILFKGDRVCVHTGPGIGIGCAELVFEARRQLADDGMTLLHQSLALSTALYEHFKNQKVHVAVDYTLTLFQKRPAQFMRAVRDVRLLQGLGLCATQVDHDGDDVELRCLSALHPSGCLTGILENSRSGQRNPELHGCVSDYAPFPFNIDVPPALMGHIGVDLPFLDRGGLAHYPVDVSQLQEARVVLETYEPQVHFTRHLEIPDARLGDWEAAISTAHN